MLVDAHGFKTSINEGTYEGHPATCRLSACIFEEINPHKVMSDIMDKFRISETKVFKHGEPDMPLEGHQFSEVVEQIYRPNPKDNLYALNIDVEDYIRVPSAVSDNFDYFRTPEPRTVANLTPAYTVVEPHIGKFSSILICTHFQRK